jgi:hypothetical protein
VTPAAAAPGTFGCTAVPLQVGEQVIGDVAANAQYNPCVAHSVTTAITDQPVEVELGDGRTYAITGSLGGLTGLDARSVLAEATAGNLVIDVTVDQVTDVLNQAEELLGRDDIPDPFTLTAQHAVLRSATDCVENGQGHPTAQHPAQVGTAATILLENGLTGEQTPVTINPGDAFQELVVDGIGTVRVNQVQYNDTRPGHKIDEVVVQMFVLDVLNTDQDIVLGQTKTDFDGQSCAPGHTGTGQRGGKRK